MPVHHTRVHAPATMAPQPWLRRLGPQNSRRITAYGTIDELNASLGLARVQ